MFRFTQSVLVWICLITIGLMLTGQSVAGVTDLKAAATGIWLFDEGKGTVVKDAAGKGLDATVKGGAKWVNGKFGKALELDGKTGYIEVPKHKSPTEAITVLAWVKSLTKTWNTNGFIAAKRNAYIIHPNTGGTKVSFPICNGACWNKPGGWKDGEVGPKDITTWHMYAGTFDSKTGDWKIFIDGKEESKLQLDKKPIAAEGEKQLWIGRDQCCDPRYGQAVFDEVAVFNIALTAGQQQGIMSTGLGAAITAVEAIEKLATTWSDLKTQ